MKTLDEVIKALEICSPHIRCDKACPYHKSGCLDYEMEKDALHYLQEYQKIMPLVSRIWPSKYRRKERQSDEDAG